MTYTGFTTRSTPQSEQADPAQVENNAGGFSFQIDDLGRLRRFLVLGSESGTYYASPRELTKQNGILVVNLCSNGRSREVVDTIAEVSLAGRAPKNDVAIFALAIAASFGTDDEKRYALSKLTDVCRTGTHILQFVQFVEQFRGWGRGLRNGVAEWYLSKTPEQLAFQVTKYRNRNGFTHRDVLRLSHPTMEKTPEGLFIDPDSDKYQRIFDWVCGRGKGAQTYEGTVIEGFIKAAEPNADIPALIAQYKLSWEMLPTESLNQASTWEALLEAGMPQTALMRNLPKLTNLGLLPQIGGWTRIVANQLVNENRLKKGRVHPFSVLLAQRTYASGRSARGSGTWSPTRQIVDALDEAFYVAFGAVEPANKRTLLALDVSGSMAAPIINTNISARDASAALALVQMRTEPEVAVVGFTSASGRSYYNSGAKAVSPLSISPRQRLDDVIKSMSNLPFGGTDCAAPMLYALEKGLEVDTFVIYTDSETWAGNVHPHQALTQYRQQTGIPARLIVVGMTSNGFSIADPSDAGSLDVVGMDGSTPNIINDFSRGEI